MKRITLLFILLLLPLFIFAATGEYKSTSRPVTLQGAIKEAYAIELIPISSSAENFMIGLPFNIEGDDVQATTTIDNNNNNKKTENEGRPIANLSFITNSNFHLKVDAQPLYHKEDTGKEHPLLYTLRLEANVAYKDANSSGNEMQQTTIIGTSTVKRAGETFETETTYLNLNTNRRENTSLYNALGVSEFSHLFIGELTGTLKFKFTQETSSLITATGTKGVSTTEYPAGEYTGTVKLTLEEVGN